MSGFIGLGRASARRLLVDTAANHYFAQSSRIVFDWLNHRDVNGIDGKRKVIV
jgi:beta-lactamase superfamily II metal-dependent hydrolase